MSFLDLFKPKPNNPPPPAAPANPGSASPILQKVGLTANALLNKVGLTGSGTAQQEHTKVASQPHTAPQPTQVKGALGDMFDSFTHKAQQVATAVAPPALPLGGIFGAGLKLAQGVLGGHEAVGPTAGPKEAAAPGGPKGAVGSALGPQGAAAGSAVGVQGAAGHAVGAQGAAGPAVGAQGAAGPLAAAAASNNFTDPKTQQFNQHGLPQTPQAWAMQDDLDGGKMHKLYDQVQVEAAKGTKFPGGADQAVVQKYIDLANSTTGATMMLEVLPTEMELATNAPVQGGKQVGTGTTAGDFRSGTNTAQTRQIAKNVLDSVAKQHPDDPQARDKMFSMLVPYNNGAENIGMHDAVPQDAVNKLHDYASQLKPNVTSMATGYSQGGAAVLEYAHQYGGTDNLKKIVALAPMGGADRHGADGAFSGVMKSDKKGDQGVDVLSLMNSHDPAKNIYDPLRDNPGLRNVRNGAVDGVLGGIGNTIHNMLPFPVQGALDVAGKYLGTPDGVRQAEHLAEAGLNTAGKMGPTVEKLAPVVQALGGPLLGSLLGPLTKLTGQGMSALDGAGDKMKTMEPVIEMIAKNPPRLGDLASITYGMADFMTKGKLNNGLKSGTGWLGQKLEQFAPALGIIGGPLLGGFANMAGHKLENKSNSMAVEDPTGADGQVIDVHGAPADGHFEQGTYGYGTAKANPLLDTFLGSSGYDKDPAVRQLQEQIANNRGQEYGRRGNWDFIRPADSSKVPDPTAHP